MIPLVYINNHTHVWGSWYDKNTGQWGYACCHSSIHASYCAGSAGIEAAKSNSAQNLLASTSNAAPSSSSAPVRSLIEEHQERLAKEKGSGKGKERALDGGRDLEGQNYSKQRLGEGDVKLDEERLQKAMQEEKKRKALATEYEDDRGKKKKYNNDVGGGSYHVSEEELGEFIHSSTLLLKEQLLTLFLQRRIEGVAWLGRRILCLITRMLRTIDIFCCFMCIRISNSPIAVLYFFLTLSKV